MLGDLCRGHFIAVEEVAEDLDGEQREDDKQEEPAEQVEEELVRLDMENGRIAIIVDIMLQHME